MTCSTKLSKLLPRSAADWQLYTSMPGVGAVARKLSSALRKALRAKDATRASVESVVGPLMVEFLKFGACDTEPLSVLRIVLDAKFGRER